MIHYTVERCRKNGGYPRHYGYTLWRTPPYVQTVEDVEGVGYCAITPRTFHFEGWFKFKRDAEKASEIKNGQ